MAVDSDLLADLAPLIGALRDVEEEVTSANGLTMWQYAVLGTVGAQAGLNQGEVARRLGYSKNRIIGDIDELERRDLIQRSAKTGDRRHNVLAITGAGSEMVAVIHNLIRSGEEDLLAPLTGREAESLRVSIATVAEAIRGK